MSRPGKNQPHPRRDPAVYKYCRTDTPTSLVDFHFVCPMPRSVLPSRMYAWLRENCEFGWLVQLPRMGQVTFKNTVVLFEAEDDMTLFRDQFCYKTVFHKRPHEADWMDQTGENI